MLSIPVVRMSLGSMRLKDDGNRAALSLIVKGEWEMSEGMRSSISEFAQKFGR